MSRKPRNKARKLSIRVRRVIGRDGHETSQSTVFCPLQAQSLELADCKTCQDYIGTHSEGNLGGSSLLCSRPSAGATAERGATTPISGSTKSISARALNASVATIMTRNTVCVRPELRVDDLVLLLVEHGISGVPVVNEAGEPVGVVSRADLLWESYDEAEARSERNRRYSVNDDESSRGRPATTVGEIMTPTAVTLPESATIAEAAAVMARHGVHRSPIVDQEGRVVGILSAADLMAWLARTAGQAAPKHFPHRK